MIARQQRALRLDSKIAITALLLLAGCTTIDLSYTDPTTDNLVEAHLVRFWSDVTLAVDPATGGLSYSSNADVAALTAMNQQLLRLALGVAAPGPP